MISKHKFGECLPLTMLSIPFLLFFSQLIFGTFHVGYIVIFLFSISFVPLAFYFKKKEKFNLELICTTGLLSFLLLFVFFSIMDYERYFWAWDEMSHWGIMTKELLRLDKFYTVADTRLLVHNEYPPFVSLFEMFFCKITGGYSEPRMYLGLHVFTTSLIIPPLADIADICGETDSRKGKILKLLKQIVTIAGISLLFLLCIAVLDKNGKWNSVYKDIVLACMVSYAMFLIACKRAFKALFGYIALIISTAAIIMTKQIGLVFVLLIWFYYGISSLTDIEIKKDKIIIAISEATKKILPVVIVPVFCYYIWKKYVEKMGIKGGQFDLGKIEISDILEMLRDTEGVSLRRQTFNSYRDAIINKGIGNSDIALTYLLCFVIIMILLFLLYKNRSLILRGKDIFILGLTITCGTMGYGITMCVLYLFCYSEIEMRNLSSYERYMSCYVLSEVILLLMVWIFAVKNKKVKVAQGVVAGAALLIMASNMNNLIPGFLKERELAFERELAENLDDKVGSQGKVFILSKDAGRMHFYVNYFAKETKIVLYHDDIINADLHKEKRKKRIEKIIFNQDYLYVCDTSDEFNRVFSWRNGNEEFQPGILYHIKEDGTVAAVE